ncbi:RidA family protein [Eoetvoesiella caeni]|uniref:Enamine deaminase RidA (YjgF/YER057c/UK114 family) n=1 Tax=Eoetvoesiella caeni TaxID=645616 RepID=A0A366HCL0_9BURK|nr:RidA family protein [Eoetvoesiella caeni]MCI2808990.1 RidA family protein [Eoetvoesiella caeni]NYT55509.1 RidA family protein [Eoetvoesiella caeni]RBP40064.1 enamine deaminase RidA (YjgF/YER057c/UK114 family) [Eoetvoesiella caeni]
MKILQPPNWSEPRGYANGTMAELTVGSRIVFVGGQVGWNAQQQFETDDLAEQVGQTLRNIVAVLKEGGAGPEHMARMTWYVRDKQEYVGALREIGKHYREILGKNFPAMTAVEVADLIEDRAKVEIEVTAVVPAAA